jgi:hypothetical protein
MKHNTIATLILLLHPILSLADSSATTTSSSTTTPYIPPPPSLKASLSAVQSSLFKSLMTGITSGYSGVTTIPVPAYTVSAADGTTTVSANTLILGINVIAPQGNSTNAGAALTKEIGLAGVAIAGAVGILAAL